MKQVAVLVTMGITVIGCNASKPILCPNQHYQLVGAQAAESDIEECRQLAKASGTSPRQGKSAQDSCAASSDITA